MQLQSIPKSPATLVMLHSLGVVLIIFNFLSGLRIQSDQIDTLVAVKHLLPQGNMWVLHSISGLLLVSLLLAYLYYWYKRRGQIRYLLQFKTFSKRPIESIAYALLLLLILGSLVSGILQLIDVKINNVHLLCAYGYLAFILLHLVAHIKHRGAYQMLRIVRPTSKLKFLTVSVIILVVSFSFGLFLLLTHASKLPVYYTENQVIIDGYANEADWQYAPKIQVLTQHGAHLNNGKSRVSVQAMYNHKNIYLYITWQDPTRSLQHLPLIKTKQGWQIQKTGFLFADENQFYEDKFAILLASGDALAASRSIHLGSRPLSHQPEVLNGRGYHYSNNGKIYDLWHWQAVRSNQHYQADDSYFGPPINAPKGLPATRLERKGGTYERYSAGYQKDPPKVWNGVGMNWESHQDAFTKPRRLPIESEDLAKLSQFSITTNSHSQGDWWLAWDDTQPYTQKKDTLPIGTVLPSVLIKSKRVSDRGNVRAHGYWKNGYWHLEIQRQLKSHSIYDVDLNNQTYLWFAVFDHSQTRHSRHLQPVKLSFLQDK